MNRVINHTLCRLCLCNGCVLVDVFGEQGGVPFVVKTMIEELLQFEVVKEVLFPWTVCSSCVAKLSEFNLFKRRCIESQLVYDNRVKRGRSSKVKGRRAERVKRIAVEVKPIDADDGLENNPLLEVEGFVAVDTTDAGLHVDPEVAVKEEVYPGDSLLETETCSQDHLHDNETPHLLSLAVSNVGSMSDLMDTVDVKVYADAGESLSEAETYNEESFSLDQPSDPGDANAVCLPLEMGVQVDVKVDADAGESLSEAETYNKESFSLDQPSDSGDANACLSLEMGAQGHMKEDIGPSISLAKGGTPRRVNFNEDACEVTSVSNVVPEPCEAGSMLDLKTASNSESLSEDETFRDEEDGSYGAVAFPDFEPTPLELGNQDTFVGTVAEDYQPKEERPDEAEEESLKGNRVPSYASVQGALEPVPNRIESKADGGVISAPAYMVLRIGDKRKNDKLYENDGDGRVSESEGMSRHMILLPVKADGTTMSLAQCSGGLNWAQHRRRDKPPVLVSNNVQSLCTKVPMRVNSTSATVPSGTEAIVSNPPAAIVPVVVPGREDNSHLIGCNPIVCGKLLSDTRGETPKMTGNESDVMTTFEANNVGTYQHMNWDSHRKQSSDRIEYICDYCGLKFADKNMLVVHVRGHVSRNGMSAMTCEVCGMGFRWKRQLLKHYNVHSSYKPYKCAICGKGFKIQKWFLMHTAAHARESTPVKCRICGKEIKRNNLLNHCTVHTESRPYKCETCGKEFKRKSTLMEHVTTHSGSKPFECGTCGKKFAKKTYFSAHLFRHSGIKPFKCEICGKGFGSKSLLAAHSTTHSRLKNFKCDTCGKAFDLKRTLRSHLLLHSGTKQYKCQVCGREFYQQGSLWKHSVEHSGIEPLKCETCGKTFYWKTALGRHMRTHARVKPFQCNVCGMNFRWKNDLKSHSYIHSCVKPFKCDTCGKTFSHKSSLKVHSNRHQGIWPFHSILP